MRLAEGVHVSSIPVGRCVPLREVELLVLVGVTGVGKSTTLEALREAGLHFSRLPDRRDVTDAVIFQGESVTDREERFRRTAAFRDAHPGGMAQALEQVQVNLETLPEPILFDGLRGSNEVQYAARAFPRARFVMLDAPDTVRVTRLLGRGDAFDRVESRGFDDEGSEKLEALMGIAGIETVFSNEEIHELARLEGTFSDVAAKVKIVVTERRHYDPKAANAFLNTLGGNRALYVDTTLEPASGVASRIAHWWRS
jgi:energy-coupling factor transporter ATP-binding protein EcfA2